MASRVLSMAFLSPPKLKKPTSSSSYSSYSPSPLSLSLKVSAGNRRIKCKALGDSSRQGSFDRTVYQGMYGPWSVDSSDVREVILYRSGLVTAAASFVAAASAAFLPNDSSLSEIIKQNLDLFYILGAGGLGLSLVLIHIYVTELKRTLQAFWVLGVVGSLATYATLAQPAGENLVHYVINNPTAVWFVGPLFAALTGLVFKEGLCYGKLEAGLLTFIIPTVLLGHMTGLMDDGIKLTLLGSWMALFVIFAGRKFTQPIKDDIGDKSVFMFKALAEDEKKAFIEKLEQQK
ncbi:hypothetical protein ACOSP7_031715 [Xanthoceras sorbifolium]